MITAHLTGLPEALATIQGFSPRRISAVTATVLTRAARAAEREWLGEIFSKIDRPTSFTLRSPLVKRATGDTLRAELLIKDQPVRGSEPAPVDWMAPHETGGGRYLKKFERALIAQFNMPADMKVVPGKYAQLDSFGNISRSQIVQVITQLGGNWSKGYARVISPRVEKRIAAAKRHGREYIAFTRQQGRRRPGVYWKNGRELQPVFLYVSRVAYRQRTHFAGAAGEAVQQHVGEIAARTIQEHVDRIAARGAAAAAAAPLAE